MLDGLAGPPWHGLEIEGTRGCDAEPIISPIHDAAQQNSDSIFFEFTVRYEYYLEDIHGTPLFAIDHEYENGTMSY